MNTKAIFLISLAGLMTAALPGSASACSWLGQAIKSSLPASGASDVPIDVAPIIRGHGDPNVLRWETQEGEPIEFDVKVGPSADFTEGTAAELVPRGVLRPNTTYVIRAPASEFGSEEQRVVFTTGVATADAELSTVPSLAATVLKRGPSQCTSHNTASCISAGEQHILLEILDASGNELVRDVVAGDVLTSATDPHCIRASIRSASGRLSAATELCGEELRIRRAGDELDGTHPCRGGGFQPAGPAVGGPVTSTPDGSETARESDTETSSQDDASLSFATAVDENAASEESGCALASGRSTSAPGSVVSLLLAASLIALQRRRRASPR